MDDQTIVALYWERSESALEETQKKYGKYCHSIAYNILHSREDAEECVNDTYVKAWDSIPPHKPERLSTFLGKLTRNISLNRYVRDHAKKRWNGTDLILEEVEEFIPAPASESSLSDEIALRDAINGFLESLSPDTRVLFVRRYWYMSPIKEIARDAGLSENNVKVTLHRLRQSFKAHLEKEGITV